MPGEDGPDWPHSEADPASSEMQAEDDDFSSAGQFASMGHDMPPLFKGMPKPGGKMVAQDAARRFRRAERMIKNADSFLEDFPMAARIGLI